MTGLIEHLRRPPWPALLGVSTAGYAVWLLVSISLGPATGGGGGDEHWHGGHWTGVELWATVPATLTLNSLGSMATWSIMLVAMMPPLLAAPIVHVRQSSLVRRRMRAVAAFVVGYAVVWLVMVVPLGLLALLADAAFGQAAFLIGVGTALAWSASPAHRQLLNRAHRLPPISLFGLRADGDCFAFGIEHGLLCAATCCAWMLVSLLAGSWHHAVMPATGMVLLAERLTVPRAPRWRMPVALALAVHLGAGILPRASATRYG